MTITFSSGDAATEITVSDGIERRQYTLETPDEVSTRPTETDQFYFPVDKAIAVTTESLTLPSVVATFVRDATGGMVAEVEHFDTHEFGGRCHSIELCAPIKLYVIVDGPVTIRSVANRMSIEFDEPRDVAIGARSYHKHPEATITTTENPFDLMEAVSALRSSLKTTTCERSYPTLRGHPPTIELGDSIDVPPELDPPETDVRIEVPPRRDYIYPVAPLAFYLGATVTSGPTPRIVTDDGFEHALNSPRGFEDEVERVLKQTFLFDCVTRTEGYYKVDLHERRAVESVVDLDFEALYDASLSEQLRAYLSVPYELVEEYVPEWKLTTHVDPTPENVELLPFLVNDLAVIRLPEGHSVSASEAQMAAITEFTRDGEDDFTRSAAGTESLGTPALVQPERTDSLEQAWAGDDAPVGASKASVQAFRNRLEREVSDGDVDITVVCNDSSMDEEKTLAEQLYGSRDELPFDVQIYHNLSTAALRAVIETDMDFLHYIGHIDHDGFDCADGKLDVKELDVVGVDAFFLNACRSYDQGMALIERGAIGGVVTLSEVINSGAVRVGKTMVRLLNQGFPLRAALEIAKKESIVGGQYIVVGDGNLDVVQAQDRMPLLFGLESDQGEYRLSLSAFPTGIHGLGSFAGLPFGDPKIRYLASGELSEFTLTREEAEYAISFDELPVKVEGSIQWSQNIDLSELT